jgi:hypothetical protein
MSSQRLLALIFTVIFVLSQLLIPTLTHPDVLVDSGSVGAD